jgi:hypothetical protein
MRLAVGNPAKNKVQKAKVASTTNLRPIALMLITTIPSDYTVAELLALNRTAEKRETDA